MEVSNWHINQPKKDGAGGVLGNGSGLPLNNKRADEFYTEAKQYRPLWCSNPGLS